MGLFSRLKVWASDETLTSSDLNGEFDNILNNFLPNKMEGISANTAAMQATVATGGVGTESLAADVAGELKRLRYAIGRIINGAQWYVAPTGSLSAGGIGTSSLADGGVTTAKLADASVTQAKLAAKNYGLSSSTSNFSGTATSYASITNASQAITSTGRPAKVKLVYDGSTNPGYLGVANGSGSTAGLNLRLKRNGTVVGVAYPIYSSNAGSGDTVSQNAGLSVAEFWDDAPPAGSNTYTLEYQTTASTTAYVFYAKLLVEEV